MNDLATEAKARVEAAASRIRSWDEFEAPSRAGDKRYVTIANGHPKAEGEKIIGCVRSAERLPVLVDRFVKACLAIKDGSTLVWRRLPEIEHWGGRYKITARLVWLD